MSSEGTVYGAAFSSSSLVDVYTQLLVPRLFAPWAEVLLDRLDPPRGGALLDIACGPGTVARVAARRVGSTGRVIGTDLSAAMVDMAREQDTVDDDAAVIEYRVSPAAPLAVEDSAVDAITCQQGLQFFPDPAAALAEMRRVLRPGGRVAIACWASVDRCTPWAALQRALADVLPADRVALVSGPFSWPGAQALRDALAEAGFSAIDAEEVSRPMVFEGGVGQWIRIVGAMPVGADVAALSTEALGRLEAAGRRETADMLGPSGEVIGELTSTIAVATA